MLSSLQCDAETSDIRERAGKPANQTRWHTEQHSNPVEQRQHQLHLPFLAPQLLSSAREGHAVAFSPRHSELVATKSAVWP